MESKEQTELTASLAFMGSEKAVWESLRYQFGILFQRAQAMFTLGALAITVTGFSGHRIVATGPAATLFLVAGLILVILGLGGATYAIVRVRWLTTFCCTEPRENLLTILRMRNRKGKIFNGSLVVMMCGLACYVTAVALFLVAAGRAAVS